MIRSIAIIQNILMKLNGDLIPNLPVIICTELVLNTLSLQYKMYLLVSGGKNNMCISLSLSYYRLGIQYQSSVQDIRK